MIPLKNTGRGEARSLEKRGSRKELSHGEMYSLGSLTAVITRRKPFERVPHESVTYFSVTKFVRV